LVAVFSLFICSFSLLCFNSASAFALLSASAFTFASASFLAFASASAFAFASASAFAFASASAFVLASASDFALASASALVLAAASVLAFDSASSLTFFSNSFCCLRFSCNWDLLLSVFCCNISKDELTAFQDFRNCSFSVKLAFCLWTKSPISFLRLTISASNSSTIWRFSLIVGLLESNVSIPWSILDWMFSTSLDICCDWSNAVWRDSFIFWMLLFNWDSFVDKDETFWLKLRNGWSFGSLDDVSFKYWILLLYSPKFLSILSNSAIVGHLVVPTRCSWSCIQASTSLDSPSIKR